MVSRNAATAAARTGVAASSHNNPTAAGAVSPAAGSAAGAGGPVNCVELRRTETRFGDGDGVYTLTEQASALNAYYDALFGPWRFAGPGRTARAGLQIRF